MLNPSSPPMRIVSDRELREFACESKFLVNSQQAELISQWARSHMQVDPHGGGMQGDTYQVSSIYFDTAGLDVFMRRGSYGRSKLRVRRYNSGDTAFLERKLKTNTLVSKRRTRVSLAECTKLQALDDEQRYDKQWSGYWFARRLQLRKLQPVCQISYQRLARLAHSDTGPCRLTLDSALAAQRNTHTDFATTQGESLLAADRYILELKYRHSLPVLFRRLLHEFAPMPQRLSKYRLAIAALNLAPMGVVTGEGL